VILTDFILAVKEGKRLSKVLKQEGKAEKQAIEIAIKELGELQYAQKKAIKVCGPSSLPDVEHALTKILSFRRRCVRTRPTLRPSRSPTQLSSSSSKPNASSRLLKQANVPVQRHSRVLGHTVNG
jgi:hypothetical protein